MKEQLNYLKSEIYKIPKDQEQKYKNKYNDYIEKIKNFEFQAKRLELELKGDSVGLLALDQGLSVGGIGKNKYGGGINQET